MRFRGNCKRGCAIREQFDRKLFALFMKLITHMQYSKSNRILRHEIKEVLFFVIRTYMKKNLNKMGGSRRN